MAEEERGHVEAHHDHHHEVAPENRDVDEAGHYELMATAIRELLVEKGVVTPEQIRGQLEFMDSRGPALGAGIIARAWTDEGFNSGCSTTAPRRSTSSAFRWPAPSWSWSRTRRIRTT